MPFLPGSPFSKRNSLVAERMNLGLESLFSTIFTFYTLLFLGCPSFFWRFGYDPVVLATFTLLLYLLRQGASQNDRVGLNELDAENVEQLDFTCPVPEQVRKEFSRIEREQNSISFNAESFVEWDVRAPLEVIHEGYEGEEPAENDGVSEARREFEMRDIRRYASLSLFYPESDEDSSSEGDVSKDGERSSPDNMCSRWEGDDGEGLIEIALENRCGEIDEENLIEIDIFPTR